MGEAIGGSLPIAVAITVSPLAIVAVVLLLTSRKARINGPAYLFGWLLALAVIGVIVLTVAGAAGPSEPGAPAAWESWLKIALGVLLLWDAVSEFRSRPRGDEQPKIPKWMATLDKTTPLAAAGVGALLAGVNPKNLLLAIGGAAAISQTGISGGQQAIAYLVFVLIATVGVGLPVGIYIAGGKHAEKLLADMKTWMSQHNAVILAVLCLVIAAKLIGDAIVSLTG